ncbi:MAG: hypothetical protein VX278_04520 [Myxococcota bacterium]|nr:hypothetical protein [Myxococcota bacterium]
MILFLLAWFSAFASPEFIPPKQNRVRLQAGEGTVLMELAVMPISSRREGWVPVLFEVTNTLPEENEVVVDFLHQRSASGKIRHNLLLPPNSSVKKEILLPFDNYSQWWVELRTKDGEVNINTGNKSVDFSGDYFSWFVIANASPYWMELVEDNQDYLDSSNIRVPVKGLPTIEGAYNSVDVVMLDATVLPIPSPQLRPILRWVQMGGSLFIYNHEKVDQEDLKRWLGEDSKTSYRLSYNSTGDLSSDGLSLRPLSSRNPVPQFRNLSLFMERHQVGFGEIILSPPQAPSVSHLAFLYSMRHRYLDDFEFSNDFAGEQRIIFISILGVVLLLLLIGPFLLQRWRKMGFIVGSIAIAVVTAVIVLVFGKVYFGNLVYGDRLEYIFLDQREKRFGRKGMESLFSNVRFQKPTSIPQTLHRADFESLSNIQVDWGISGEQTIFGSLLPDRQLRLFRFLHYDSTRLRIEFGDDGTIQNALGVPIQKIYYRSQDGSLWFADDLGVGKVATLESRNELSEDLQYTLTKMSQGSASELPAGTYVAELFKSPFSVDMGYRFQPSSNEITILGVTE